MRSLIQALAAALLVLPAVGLRAQEIRETPAVALEPLEAEGEAAQPTLEELLWVARPVVVFADSENDPRFLQQMQMLEERSEDLAERKAVVLVDTDPAAKGPLRQALRPRGFGLVLIDTDGSVVQRRPSPTSSRELINLIDRLPSRRLESGSRRQ